MNIAEIEARQTWLVERFDAPDAPDYIIVGTGPVSDWTGEMSIEACQPPF